MKRNTLILLALGLVFGAYLILVEANRDPAKPESSEPKQQYVLDFAVEEVTAATIAFGAGVPAHIEKTEAGWQTWDEQNPERYSADEDWVKDFLELVRGVQGAGLVEEGAVNLGNYGIGEGKPYIEIRGKSATGEEWTRSLRLGDKSPLDEKFYVTNDAGKAVYLMAGYLRGQLDRGVANFRPRRPLSFDQGAVARIEIAHHAGEESLVITRNEGNWQVENAEIDGRKVDGLLGNLTYLTVSEFTFDKLADRAPEFGLDEPSQTIRLLDTAGNEIVMLSIGNREGEGDYYAASSQWDEVFTLKPSSVSELPRTVADLAPPPPPPAEEAPPIESEDIEAEPAPPADAPADDTDHAQPH